MKWVSILTYMDDNHMMDWWGVSFMGFWMVGIWVLQVIIAFLVYQDAEKRGINGLLWFVLVILPWIGFLFLILYLIIREEKKDTSKSAVDILDKRYAKGEITREEYVKMKKDIQEGS